jgi:hypothetical protein
MRSAGIVAGLFLIGLVANCGGDDSGGTGNPAAGTTSSAGEGGENTGATSNGGSSTAGTKSSAGEGGMAPMLECTKDADCGAAAKCVDNACKKNDGEACAAAAECQNACIDGKCTAKLPDDSPCTADDQCAHTCIDGTCVPVSELGGDCDVVLPQGAGGAGGDGAGGNSSGGNGAGGDSSVSVPQNPDCIAPLQCFSGKCLTPDGEACKDNVDCINTCVKNKCVPKSGLDGACDATDDCLTGDDKHQLTCDLNKAVCKLKTLSECTANGQCSTNKCYCSDKNCSVRNCKSEDSSCTCRYSPPDAPSCSADSPEITRGVQDPNGCNASNNHVCGGQGDCILNEGGKCDQGCSQVDVNSTPNDESDDKCFPSGSAKGCNGGYTPTVTTECHLEKISTYPAAADYACRSTCACPP